MGGEQFPPARRGRGYRGRGHRAASPRSATPAGRTLVSRAEQQLPRQVIRGRSDRPDGEQRTCRPPTGDSRSAGRARRRRSARRLRSNPALSGIAAPPPRGHLVKTKDQLSENRRIDSRSPPARHRRSCSRRSKRPRPQRRVVQAKGGGRRPRPRRLPENHVAISGGWRSSRRPSRRHRLIGFAVPPVRRQRVARPRGRPASGSRSAGRCRSRAGG